MSAVDVLDDSSSDDDFYQNLTKTMKRKVTNGFSINDEGTDDDSFTLSTNIEPALKKSRETVAEEDTDDDDMSFQSTNIQKILEAKSKMYEAQVKEVKKTVTVTSSVRTRSSYKQNTNKEIEIASQLLLLESLDAQVKACTSSCEFETINQSEKEPVVVEDEEECVHFLINNLENPSEASSYRSWKLNDPISILRREYSVIWGCSIREVVITCKNLPLQDSDTPTSLQMPNEVQLINVFRVGVEKKKDPNKIVIKCLQADKRPVEFEISKTTKFSILKTLIEKRLQITTIKKLVFDSSQVQDDETPEDLDMENEDCLEIYS